MLNLRSYVFILTLILILGLMVQSIISKEWVNVSIALTMMYTLIASKYLKSLRD